MLAAKAYYKLPQKYPNPYDGLMSLGISPKEYQEIYNQIPVGNFIKKDEILLSLMNALSKTSEITILSFAPEMYVKRVLSLLGVIQMVDNVVCMSEEYHFQKLYFYEKMSLKKNTYKKIFVMGDDYINDILPAQKLGFITYLISFDDLETSIYCTISNVIKQINCSSDG